MYSFILVIHVIVTVGLIGIVLVQRGRSSGLVEALGGVESIFGTKTNTFFVRLTATLAVLFFVTSISLAYLSKQRNKSLLEGVPSQPPVSLEETGKIPSATDSGAQQPNSSAPALPAAEDSL